MPTDVEQRNSPGWWMKRLFFQLNDRNRRQRLWKLHNYYAGSPPMPEGAEAAGESFEAFQRHSRSNVAELITSAVSERMTPVGFRTAGRRRHRRRRGRGGLGAGWPVGGGLGYPQQDALAARGPTSSSANWTTRPAPR